MPLTLLGPEVEAFERGKYSAQDATAILTFCDALDISAAKEPQDIVDKFMDLADGQVRVGAMSYLDSVFNSSGNASSIDLALRLLAYFSQHTDGHPCVATARRIPFKSGDPTYLVAFHAAGVPVIRERIASVAAALKSGTSSIPLPPFTDLLDATVPAERCLMLAVCFVFLHEFGHVIGGHIDWTPSILLPCNNLPPQQQLERRALEIHADVFAASFIGKLLKAYSDLEPENDPNRQKKWLLFGLLALYSVFTSVAESSAPTTTCYHSPYVRLLHSTLWLGSSMGLGMNPSKLAAAALTDRLFGTDEAERARGWGVGPGTPTQTGTDSKAFDDITMPLLKQMIAAGRLRGHLTE